MIHSLGHSVQNGDETDRSPSKRMHEQMLTANLLQGHEICHKPAENIEVAISMEDLIIINKAVGCLLTDWH